MREKMKRVEGAEGRREYSRPVMLIEVGGLWKWEVVV